MNRMLTPDLFIDYEWSDILIMAATIFGEARGEVYSGKVAVAWVIRNRAANPSWWGNSIASVCLKPYQFSCWNSNDPNSDKVKEFAYAKDLSDFLDKPIYQECLLAALMVLRGKHPDDTMGSTHYHTHSISPDWSKGKVGVRIGNHKFYNDVE